MDLEVRCTPTALSAWVLAGLLSACGIAAEQNEAQPPGSPVPRPDPPDPLENHRPFHRLDIRDLDDVEGPPPDAITTMALSRRSGPSERAAWPGIRVVTRCAPAGCVDGLIIDGRTLIPPSPTAEEQQWIDEHGGSLERVIRVGWDDLAEGRYVSIYVAETSLAPGAARSNNRLYCRTLERSTGRMVRLHDILPVHTDWLLTKVEALAGGRVGPDVLIGAESYRGYETDALSFRLDSLEGHHAMLPEVVMCAEGDHTSEADMLEIRLQAIPVGYLFR